MNGFYSHGKQVGPIDDKYNYLITFYVDGRVLHFRRHAVMATLFFTDILCSPLCYFLYTI